MADCSMIGGRGGGLTRLLRGAWLRKAVSLAYQVASFTTCELLD